MSATYCFILWTICGLQHSLMARPFFKKIIKDLFDRNFEKYFYTFIHFISQCIIFILIYDLIRNLKTIGYFYSISPDKEICIYFLNRIANIFLIITVFHFDIGIFTGITQLKKFFTKLGANNEMTQVIDKTYLYRYIRHPMYLGIILVYITSKLFI